MNVPLLKARVLAVDDDEGFLASLCRSLEVSFERVDCVESIDEAWRRLESDDYDLILLEVLFDNEPGGLEMCRRVKADARWRDTPLVFVSDADLMYGMSLKSYLGQDSAVPADGFIDKLEGCDEIAKRVRSILEKPVPDEV